MASNSLDIPGNLSGDPSHARLEAPTVGLAMEGNGRLPGVPEDQLECAESPCYVKKPPFPVSFFCIEFVPLTLEEAKTIQPKLQELDFRPFSLSTGFLCFALFCFVATLAGVVTLIVFEQTQPPWFQLQTCNSYNMWNYFPSAVAVATTVIYRSIATQYNRFIPYVNMAQVNSLGQFRSGDGPSAIRSSSSGSSTAKLKNKRFKFFAVPLNAIVGGFPSIPILWSLLWRGYPLSFLINLAQAFNTSLAPVKSGFLQPIQAESGWTLVVSTITGVYVASVYLVLSCLTLAILIHLWRYPTGLRWSPYSIAAQISLVQGSNIFPHFEGFEEVESTKQINSRAEKWRQDGRALRLGYWKRVQKGPAHDKDSEGTILHGIRFVPVPKPKQGFRIPLKLPNVNSFRRHRQPAATTPLLAKDQTTIELSDINSGRDGLSGTSDGLLTPLPETASGSSTPLRPSEKQATAGSTLILPSEAASQEAWTGGLRVSIDDERSLITSSRHKPSSEERETSTLEKKQDHNVTTWYWVLDSKVMLFTFFLGVVALVVSSYWIAKGRITEGFAYPPLLTTHLIPESVRGRFERGLVFFTLPTILFTLFNWTFVTSDLYHRTMAPITNMTSYETPKDAKGKAAVGSRPTKDERGALGMKSMLVDYLSPDPATVMVTAYHAREYQVAWGVFLGLVCSASHIPAGRIFAFQEINSQGRYVMAFVPVNFYISFAVLALYLVLLWIARPLGVARSARPPFTLLDVVGLCYQSDLLDCPEFWAQEAADGEEHLRARVVLAGRRYLFGRYTRNDGSRLRRVGIGINGTPPQWLASADNSARRGPAGGSRDAVDALCETAALARAVLNTGVFDADSSLKATELTALLDKPRIGTIESARARGLRETFTDVVVKTRGFLGWHRKPKRMDTEGGKKYAKRHFGKKPAEGRQADTANSTAEASTVAPQDPQLSPTGRKRQTWQKNGRL